MPLPLWCAKIVAIPNLLSMVATYAVIMITYDETSDDKAGIMTTLSFQWSNPEEYGEVHRINTFKTVVITILKQLNEKDKRAYMSWG